MIENANYILFRSSGLGHLMVEPKNKTELIAEGVKTHLVDIFVSSKYGRREEINSKFLDKGNQREEDSTTIVSRIEKRFFKHNTEHLSNNYIKGTPDLFEGENIHNATAIRDTKTSWSANTFFRAKKSKLEKNYYWQVMGYMWLTGAKKATVDYCLVNGTYDAIQKEKRILGYQNGMQDFNGNLTDLGKERMKQIEINHIFDLHAFLKEYPHYEFENDVNNWKWDIPYTERHFKFEVERNEIDIANIGTQVSKCRAWMNQNLFNINQ